MGRCISLTKVSLTVLLCFAASMESRAQMRENTFMVGMGGMRMQDTYLSPLKYSGWQVQILWTTEKERGFICHLGGNFSRTQPVGATMARPVAYTGGVTFDAGWHYRWYPLDGLRVTLGALGGMYGGVAYNERNSNNPANAHVNIRFSATVGARYNFNLWHRTWRVDYRADVPVIGVLFSPEYGESYYEISKYGAEGCIKPLWFGNGLNIRQQLSLDIPFKYFYLRVAYVSDIRQQSVNDLKWHEWGNAAMIGVVRRFTIVKNR